MVNLSVQASVSPLPLFNKGFILRDPYYIISIMPYMVHAYFTVILTPVPLRSFFFFFMKPSILIQKIRCVAGPCVSMQPKPATNSSYCIVKIPRYFLGSLLTLQIWLN